VDKRFKKDRTDRIAYLAAQASFMLAEQRFFFFCRYPDCASFEKKLKKKETANDGCA